MEEEKWKRTEVQEICGKKYSYETGNGVGFEGVRMLVESLKANSVLTQLDLRGKEVSNKVQDILEEFYVWHWEE